MPHPHAGPAPPPNAAAYISTNASVLIWDALTATCNEQSFDTLVGDPPSQTCCPGGMFIRSDLPRRGGQDAWIPLVWCIILAWIFVPGVAMGADTFMASIEVITATEYVVVRKVQGKFKEYHVRVWNNTVANLTLMALGSSAPEILLSVIEIVGGSFHSGTLGPSTIVGSAAFNLMVITAVCISAIPAGETRSIEQLAVFLTTSAYSLFAYIWLLIIVQVWTPNVITIIEGVLTCLFLLLLIAQAYYFDRYAGSIGKSCGFGVTRPAGAADPESGAVGDGQPLASMKVTLVDAGSHLHSIIPADQRRTMTPEQMAEVLRQNVDLPRKPRAQLRKEGLAATFHHKTHTGSSTLEDGRSASKSTPGETSPMSSSQVALKVVAVSDDGRRTTPAVVESAKDRGRVFSAELGGEGTAEGAMPPKRSMAPKLPPISENGVLKWRHGPDDAERACVRESDKQITLYVERAFGSKGRVSVKYKTKNQTALAGTDYIPVSGELVFEAGDMEAKPIKIEIVDDDKYEEDEEFTVILYDPEGGATFDGETDGGEAEAIFTVTINSDDDAERAVMEQALALLHIDKDKMGIAAADWGSQFAVLFDLEDRSIKGRFNAALAFPWKLMFAFVPPPSLGGGWWCFVGALVGIAIQVVLISDFASQMGCEMYLKDSVTAITFVALGTSLPDTFASMQAATQDKTADNSIGNVTGSNSVNVFFGLGLPWLMAAIYWSNVGADEEWFRRYADIPGLLEQYPNGAFVVRGGDLGFSVVVFTCCAVITIGLILVRRAIGKQELGGNKLGARASSALLVFLWFMYVLLSSMKSYETELGIAPFGF